MHGSAGPAKEYSFVRTFGNIFISFVGAGVLGLPYAFKMAGVVESCEYLSPTLTQTYTATYIWHIWDLRSGQYYADSHVREHGTQACGIHAKSCIAQASSCVLLAS